MSIAQGQILQKSGFPCTLQAVLGSHGIVVKCTAAIFFPTEDSRTYLMMVPAQRSGS